MYETFKSPKYLWFDSSVKKDADPCCGDPKSNEGRILLPGDRVTVPLNLKLQLLPGFLESFVLVG